MATTPTAISDYKTYLYVESATAGKYTKLVDITSAPATGAAPKSIDVTTMSDAQTVGIADRPETPSLEFEYNYNKTDFAAVAAAVSLTASKNYLIAYQDGSGFTFSATGATYVKEVSVGKAVTAGIGLIASSVPVFVPDTTTLTTT